MHLTNQDKIRVKVRGDLKNIQNFLIEHNSHCSSGVLMLSYNLFLLFKFDFLDVFE